MKEGKKTQMTRKDIPKVKEELFKKQKYLCKICKRDLRELPSRDVCLDHSHESWMVRAVLCRQCNVLEAKIKRLFIRTGARNKGIDYIEFLKGLIKFQNIKDTHWIYPPKPKKRKKIKSSVKTKASRKKK